MAVSAQVSAAAARYRPVTLIIVSRAPSEFTPKPRVRRGAGMIENELGHTGGQRRRVEFIFPNFLGAHRSGSRPAPRYRLSVVDTVAADVGDDPGGHRDRAGDDHLPGH